MTASSTLFLQALPGMPVIEPGDDLPGLIGDAIEAAGLRPEPRDVLVVTHKIVSKAEGRVVDLDAVEPSPAALKLADETDKPAALCEVVLRESRQILRKRPGLIIAEHRLGAIMANAGIDRSNVSGNGKRVLLLPEDPDRSAAGIAEALAARFGTAMAVVISDSVGRAWRKGVVGLAIGAAGLPAVVDLRGRRDMDGRELQVTEVGFADEIASAAELLMGEADEGRPAVLIRGLSWDGRRTPASALVRDPTSDLFR